MILQIPLGKLFQTALGKISDSTGDILYSAEEYSYTPLGNIKTAGDAPILAGEYSYTPLGNIFILRWGILRPFWGYPTFLGLMVD